MHTQKDFLLFAHVWLDLSFEKGKGKGAFGESPSTQPPSPKRMSDVFRTRDGWGKNGSPLQKCPKICGRMREVVGLFFVFVLFLSILQYVHAGDSCLLFLLGWSPHIFQRMEPRGAIDQYQKFGQQKKFYCFICQRLFRDCYGTDTKNLRTLYFNARSFSCK